MMWRWRKLANRMSDIFAAAFDDGPSLIDAKKHEKKNKNNASREPHMFRRNYPPSIKSAFQPQKTTFCSGSVLAAGIKIDFAVIGFKYENMFHFGSDAAHNEPRSG